MITQPSPVRRHGMPVAALALSLILPLAPRAADARQAQTAAPPTPAPAAGAGRREALKNVNSLGDILAQLDWDAAERGPLLIVAPDKTTRFRPKPKFEDGVFKYPPPVELRAPGARGYNLRNVDEVFDRKVMDAGGLTVLAPRTMTLLNLRFPPPSAYAGMTHSEKVALFQGSLSPEQWGKMASDGGLGWGDLSEEQREMLRASFPDPFVINKTVPSKDPERPYQPPERITLTPNQVQGIRLSVRRRLNLMLSQEGERWSYYGLDPDTTWGGGSGPTYSIQTRDGYYIEGKAEMFGVDLKSEVPNRAKPGELNFDAEVLSRTMALEGAATVRDLVKRAAEATGLELYADPRYGALKVHVRGGAAKTGDVLKGLALCVTGTWRKVEDGSGAKAWVLTDDLQGLGIKHALIRRWGRANAALQAQRQKSVFDAVRAAKPEGMLRFHADDPLAPDEALSKDIAAHQELLNRPPDPKSPNFNESGLQVPMVRMPEAVKQAAQRVAQNHNRHSPQKPLDLTKVRVDMTASLHFEVPGVGRVPAPGAGLPGRYSLLRDDMAYYRQYRKQIMRGDLPKPPLALGKGASAGERALLAAPRTPEEAAALAKSAAERGIDRLWIDVPAAMTPDGFAALVKSANGAAPQIQVYAAVRLWRTAPGGGPPAPAEEAADSPDEPGAATAAHGATLDVNILGEPLSRLIRRTKKEPSITEPHSYFGTSFAEQRRRRLERSAEYGDYRRPDRAENVAAVKARVRALARTPGIAGIVARDVLPPGYERGAASNYGYDFDQMSTEEDFGYSPETRLAFLRRHGADPIDLVTGGEANMWSLQRFSGGGGSVDLRLPFFRDSGQANPWESPAAPKPGQPLPLPAAWNVFRRELAEATLDEVFQAVRTEPGGDGLRLIRERASFAPFSGSGGYEVWERGAGVKLASTVPAAPQEGSLTPLRGMLVVGTGGDAWTDPEGEKPSPVEQFGYGLASMLRYSPPGVAGLVLDMSEVSPGEATLLLTAIKPGAPPARPSAPANAKVGAAAAAAKRP